MNSCPSARQLDRLLADGLDADEHTSVSAHVETCADCQQTLEHLTRQDTEMPVRRLDKTSVILTAPDASFLRRMENLSPRELEHWSDDAKTVVSSDEPPTHIVRFSGPPAIPGFEILSEVGRGGMAVVYKARQTKLKRLVALKMILAGDRVGPDRLARFRSEAEAVARLHHPGIVQIYETGEHRGMPFLALEFVAGGSLSQKTRDRAQPPRQSAALIESVALAIDTAHRAGIVHRDLTPSNILLAEPPAGVDDDATAVITIGTPKITDFGLAIDLAEDSRQTRTGEVVGTPQYMAPEQAQGQRKEYGPATDIHALGTILYELLTGRAPYIGATAVDTLVQVSYEDPVPPTRLRADLPRDLEVICLKCLQKEPRHRYASAQSLAADLRRFLNGEPIVARPTSIGGRVIKWARRRPWIAGLTAASLLLTVVALASLSWALAQESHRRALAESNEQTQTDLRHQAQTERLRAEHISAAALLDQAVSQGDHGSIDRALLLLVRSLELAAQIGDRDLERAARINLTAWRRHLFRQRAAMTHRNWVWTVAYSPDGKSFVTASRDQSVQLWETATGARIGDPMPHHHPVWAVAFRPDGNTLVTASGQDRTGELRFWDAHTGQSIGQPLASDQHAHGVAFSPDGATLLSVGASKALLWKFDTRGSAPNVPVAPAMSLPHPRGVFNAVLSLDGSKVVTGGLDGTVQMWAADTGKALGVTLRHELPADASDDFLCRIVALAFSPDGTMLATGSQLVDAERRFIGGEVRLWRADGTPHGQPLAHRGPIKTLAFSPDGRLLLTGAMTLGPKLEEDFQGEARLWDVQTGKQLCPTLEMSKPVWAVAFSPDRRTMMTGCENGHVGFWVTATGLRAASVAHEGGNITSVAFAPDGRTALSSKTYEPATARLWEVPAGRGAMLPPLHDGPARHVAFAAGGKILLSAGDDGKLLRWDLETGRAIGTPMRHRGAINGLVVSRDGLIAATASTDQTAQVWDVLKGEALGQPLEQPLVHGLEKSAIALSPDGKMVLMGVGGMAFRRWDWASSRPIGDELKHDWYLTNLIFSPDGSVIASSANDHTVRLWDAATGRPIGKPLSHGGAIPAIAFSPDGKLLATASRDQLVRLWVVSTGDLFGKPMLHGDAGTLAFSPDGGTLISASGSHTAWLFDVATGKPRCPPLQHRTGVTTALISPDGRTAATIADRDVRLWDMATGHQLGSPATHPGPVTSAAFHPESDRIVTACDDGLIRIWDVPSAATGDVGEVRLWVETLTGMQLGEQGILHELDAATLASRRQALRDRGPEPFPPPRK